jgi:hypothetical protein
MGSMGLRCSPLGLIKSLCRFRTRLTQTGLKSTQTFDLTVFGRWNSPMGVLAALRPRPRPRPPSPRPPMPNPPRPTPPRHGKKPFCIVACSTRATRKTGHAENLLKVKAGGSPGAKKQMISFNIRLSQHPAALPSTSQHHLQHPCSNAQHRASTPLIGPKKHLSRDSA